MKITPGQVAVTANTNAPTSASQDARARAISKLSVSNPIPTDANNVSVEELGSVHQPTKPAPVEVKEVEAPTPKETKEETPLSNQYAILARKEKALRAQAQKQQMELKSERERIASERQQWEQQKQTYEKDYIPKSKLKERTLESLAEAGVTYEEVTQRQIEAGEVSPTVKAYLDRLEARIAKADAELASFKQSGVEQQGEAYKAAIRQIDQDVRTLVFTDPEFETIKATNSSKDVTELIESTFKKGLLKPNARHDKDYQFPPGSVMSAEEAARIVEEHLVDEIDKLTNIEKIKKRKQSQNASESAPQKQPPSPQKQPQSMKTLTNATGSTRQLNARERAVLAFKGELK